MTEQRVDRGAPRGKIIAAFAAVYLIWGSTYLGIRIAIESIPPFVMAAGRFLIGGAVLLLWARATGAPRPTRRNWAAALVIGGLLLCTGNGGVVWAEQRVPSGITSLLVASVPLWMVVMEWARRGGARPTLRVMVGIALGLAGLVLLIQPHSFGGEAPVSLVAAGVLVAASLSWATGSVFAKRAPLPSSPLLATGMEMLCGGALLLALSVPTGELAAFHPSAITTRSLLALAYLVAFGSLVGFTAYVWLLRVASPARVATYAYVNPVVAVLLGWLVGGEALGARTILAAAVIVGAVALITTGQSGAPRRRPADAREAPRATPHDRDSLRAAS